MDVVSLGLQTDLALLRLGGAEVRDAGTHLVVSSPLEPEAWWGSFLLLPGPPPPERTEHWLAQFARDLPGADHVCFAFDGTADDPACVRRFAESGLVVERSAVLTAQRMAAPAHVAQDAVCRELVDDADWAAHLDLRVACLARDEDPVRHRAFAVARSARMRRLAEAGLGAWWGAFVDGRLLATMGLYLAWPGVARFQSVETHPLARRRGLAGTLLHHVGAWGLTALGAQTLVIVTDPETDAVRLYRSLGFTDAGWSLQAERGPV